VDQNLILKEVLSLRIHGIRRVKRGKQIFPKEGEIPTSPLSVFLRGAAEFPHAVANGAVLRLRFVQSAERLPEDRGKPTGIFQIHPRRGILSAGVFRQEPVLLLGKIGKDGGRETLFRKILPHPRLAGERALLALLQSSSPKAERNISTSSAGVELVDFVNAHLCDPVSVSMVTEQFHMSTSQVSRLFKAATGTTLGQYCLAKRLLKARRRISSGMSAQQAALECGFGCYSSFFRLYKKKFGTVPSDGK
jgi:AraC-like DNA-binding protein